MVCLKLSCHPGGQVLQLLFFLGSISSYRDDVDVVAHFALKDVQGVVRVTVSSITYAGYGRVGSKEFAQFGEVVLGYGGRPVNVNNE